MSPSTFHPSNSAIASFALSKFHAGSHDVSCSGYPAHLTRYSIHLYLVRQSRIFSTLNSSCSSIVIRSGGAGGSSRSDTSLGSWYCFNNDTWKTGCILIIGGNSRRYATGDTFSIIRYGPINRACNFFEGCFACDANQIFAADNSTCSPTSNDSSRRT